MERPWKGGVCEWHSLRHSARRSQQSQGREGNVNKPKTRRAADSCSVWQPLAHTWQLERPEAQAMGANARMLHGARARKRHDTTRKAREERHAIQAMVPQNACSTLDMVCRFCRAQPATSAERVRGSQKAALWRCNDDCNTNHTRAIYGGPTRGESALCLMNRACVSLIGCTEAPTHCSPR